mgnify:CR=1 FL=1
MGGAVLSGEGGRVCAPLRGSLGGIVLVHVFVVGFAVRTGTGGGFGGVRASVVAVGTVARRADLAADAEERSHGILLLLFLLLRCLPDGGRVRVDGVGGCVCVHLDVSVRVSGFYHHLHRDARSTARAPPVSLESEEGLGAPIAKPACSRAGHRRGMRASEPRLSTYAGMNRKIEVLRLGS